MKHISLLISLLVLLASCTPNVPTQLPTTIPEPAAAPTIITFGVSATEVGNYTPLVRRFEAEHPTIRIRLLPLDELLQGNDDSDAQLFIVAQQADVALLPTSTVAQAQQAGSVLRDLTALLDADPSFERSDLYPNALSGSAGAIHALSREINVRLIFYNADLLKAEGRTPRLDWTVAEVLQTAEQLALQQAGQTQRYGLLGDWGDIREAALATFAAAGIDTTSDPSSVNLATPAAEQALERLVQLRRSGALYQHPPADSVSTTEFVEPVRETQIAMWAMPLNLGSSLTFKVGVAPFPVLPMPMFGQATSYVISNGTQHPEAAWRWLAFLSRQYIDSNLSFADRAVVVPARRSLAEQHYLPTLDQRSGIDGAALTVRAAAEQRVLQLNWPTGLDLVRAANQVENGTTPAEALAEAQTRIQQRAPAQIPVPPAAITVATPPPALIARPGTTTINFIVTTREFSRFQALAERFNQEQAAIFVQVIPEIGITRTNTEGRTSTNYDPKVQAEVADCFRWGGIMPDPETVLVDLQPLLDADPSFPRDDYPAQLLDALRANQRLYGLPESVSLPRLMYNPSLFAAANLAPPQGSWTPDDFLRTAQQLTNKNQQQFGYVALNSHPNDLAFFLRRFNASPARGPIDNPTVHFTEPAVLEALRWYLELLQTASPHTRFEGYHADLNRTDLFSLFEAGQTGMWFDNPYNETLDDLPYQLGIAAPPFGQSSVSHKDFGEQSSYFISLSSQHPQACWQWLRFLSEQPGLVSTSDAFPARVSQATSPEFTAQIGTEAAQLYTAYREALQRPALIDRQSRWEFMQASDMADGFWFYQALDRAMQGSDLLRELEDAQFTTEQFIKCRRGGDGWLACAKQVDPQYRGFAIKFGE
jgi:ABC-type glycerol-3-phosphate transport system substrate-binding protein